MILDAYRDQFLLFVAQTLTNWTVRLQVAVQHEIGEETPENRTKSVAFFISSKKTLDFDSPRSKNGIEHVNICETTTTRFLNVKCSKRIQ